MVSENQNNEEAVVLDPEVEAFMDAKLVKDKLRILDGLHHRITDEMITMMSIVCDIMVPEGDIEDRYTSFRQCLQTQARFETDRFR